MGRGTPDGYTGPTTNVSFLLFLALAGSWRLVSARPDASARPDVSARPDISQFLSFSVSQILQVAPGRVGEKEPKSVMAKGERKTET